MYSHRGIRHIGNAFTIIDTNSCAAIEDTLGHGAVWFKANFAH